MRQASAVRTLGPMPGSRAFVVEDHPVVSAMLALWLAECGLNVEECEESDLERIEAADRNDLVVIDLCLGDDDGIAVLERLSLQGYPGRVLLISAMPQNVLDLSLRIGRRFGLNVIGALRKPIRIDALRDILVAPVSQASSGETGLQIANSPYSLGQALSERAITFHYQPIVHVGSMLVHGVELLARVRGAGGSISSIAGLLRAASEADIVDLTFLALRQAESVRTILKEVDPAICVSVNVPCGVIHSRPFRDVLRSIRHGTRAANAITLEFSEFDTFLDLPDAQRAAAQAVLHGFRLALDDFGRENSNLERLSQFPFSELKLDRAFVAGCAQNAFRRAVCRGAVDIGHAHGAMIIAEGVESTEDLEALRTLGVDCIQGYLISRPLELEAFINWINRRELSQTAYLREDHA